MSLLLIRLFFIFVATLLGWVFGNATDIFGSFSGFIGMSCGFVFGVLLTLAERAMGKISSRGLSSAVFGLILGIVFSRVVINAVVLIPMSQNVQYVFRAFLTIIFCYLGMVIAMKGKDEFNIVIPYLRFTRQDVSETPIILDTNIVIDGRIMKLCSTKFLEGRLIIPRFVLRELQYIADSEDSLRKTRGRRGLEILNQLQNLPGIDVKIHEEDFPEIQEVDAKIIHLAKLLGGKVLTNDYNLAQVAELQGITALNINELARALKPVVLPGEMLSVRVIKEGKEHNQGVAYLDDGTMIVVEQGKQHIGREIEIEITSILQTQAGQMIFSKPASFGKERSASRRKT